MSKEAMKLALEALKELVAQIEGRYFCMKHDHVALQNARFAIARLREALAKPDFWEGYVPEPDKRQQALDKKAENARALGLDYEPEGGTQVSKVWWDGEKLMAKPIPLEDFYEPAQQEPVAWRTFDGEGGYEYRSYEMNEQYAQEWEQRNPKHKGWVEPLYTTPPPCPTCEALARTVMMDQTGRDA